MRVLVVGAGAWGTALAVSAARDGARRVSLWARDANQVAEMAAQRENRRYLPGVVLPASLCMVHSDDASLAELAQAQDLVVIGTPMAGLRSSLVALAGVPVPMVWLCKGFEAAQQQRQGLLGHEVWAELAPQERASSHQVPARCGVLSGPSFAQEVARGQPTALVAASPHAEVRDAMVQAFHGPTLRVYANDDMVGVEVGGAVKNVLAIATGLCDGLQLGLNARAALITRGLAEITRLGVALGARADTFMGLSGLGDLVLTATGDLSRNRKVGLLLAQGQTLQHAVDSLGHVAEGVYCARTVVQRARHLGVDMPIAEAVLALLDGELRPDEAVGRLMGRDPAAEQPRT